jgi:hypothetical protein
VKAAAAEKAKQSPPRCSHLRPALAEKPSNGGKKVVRVQTKARRIQLGARAQAAVYELKRRKSIWPFRIARLHLSLTLY